MRDYYVIDIGGDAFDQPTRRAAVATARAMMRQPSVSRGQRWHKAEFVYVYLSSDNPSRDKKPVYLTWSELDDHGKERVRATFDKYMISSMADLLELRRQGVPVPRRH